MFYQSHAIKFNYTIHGRLTMRQYLKKNNVYTKASETLSFLSQNLKISSTSVKEHVYQSLIRSSIACIVSHPNNKVEIDKFEMVELRTAGFYTNKQRNT